MFSQRKILKSTKDHSAEIDRLKNEIETADAIVNGAGPQQLDLLTVENALKNTSPISLKNINFEICIPVVSIHLNL